LAPTEICESALWADTKKWHLSIPAEGCCKPDFDSRKPDFGSDTCYLDFRDGSRNEYFDIKVEVRLGMA